MNALTKITLRNIKLNRKRAWVTIIGIMLATALIVVVADMAESFRSSMVEYERVNSGDYHYCFYDVDPANLKCFEENRNIEKLGYSVDLGYTELTGSRNVKKPYLYLKAMDESAMQVANVTLTEGRLPENDHEIVISDSIRTNGGIEYRVGDTIRLTNSNREDAKCNEEDQTCEYTEGERLTDSGKATGEYTVVGIMKRLMRSQEPYYAPGYTVITRITDVTQYSDVTVYASYTKSGLKRREEVTAGLLKLPLDTYRKYQNGEPLNGEEQQLEESQKIASYVTCNIWLLKYQLLLFSDGSLKMLYSMAGIAIAIIIVTSVFCIRNSFVISLTEKMHLYGMLSSIGTTGKQRKKLIYGEALILGAVGIPLGIILGLLAGWLVIKGTGHLMQNGLQITLSYVISWPTILVSIVLAVITILLSAGQSARKAAKISPIQAIRGNDTVRISRKEVRMPKWLSRCFGIGGTIAYKNLKRARVKYRTTIISIVVSVAVFIGMSSFMSMAMEITNIYYVESSYQLIVAMDGKDQMEDARRILELDGVNQAEICQTGYVSVPVDEVKYNGQYQSLMGDAEGEEDQADETFILVALNPEAFQAYAEKLGCTVNDGDNQAILISDVTKAVVKDGKEKYVNGELYDYQAGDVLQGITQMTEKPISMRIIKSTTERPMSVENVKGLGLLVTSNSWLADYSEEFHDTLDVYISCDDPDGLQNVIESDMGLANYSVRNLKEDYEASKSLFTLIGVFLYGFIIVIALIGITNIFNTITTNMELRSREFATLKSIGMTRKEFRRVIWLESLFYGVKSLLIGIPAGILISIGFHMALGTNLETAYHLPWTGILISIGAVFILLFGIMRYSMGRINRKNIIETIQSENI